MSVINTADNMAVGFVIVALGANLSLTFSIVDLIIRHRLSTTYLRVKLYMYAPAEETGSTKFIF